MITEPENDNKLTDDFQEKVQEATKKVALEILVDPFAEIRAKIQHLPLAEQIKILETEKRQQLENDIRAKINEECTLGNLDKARKMKRHLDKWIRNGRRLFYANQKKIV